jgi:hypothetical protein
MRLLEHLDRSDLSIGQRRLAATLIAGVIGLALAITSITLGGHAIDGAGFLFFILSLPWTVSVYAVTMLIGVNSPMAIIAALAVPTIIVWRVVSVQLIKRCVG